jgi:hypothetical protein
MSSTVTFGTNDPVVRYIFQPCCKSALFKKAFYTILRSLCFNTLSASVTVFQKSAAVRVLQAKVFHAIFCNAIFSTSQNAILYSGRNSHLLLLYNCRIVDFEISIPSEDPIFFLCL